MTTTTRPNGFPTLNMAPSNRNIQNSGSHNNSAWSQNIWGVSGSINSHHETVNSRAGSDEVSPTAPSASAQFSTLPERTPWPSREIWRNTSTSPNNTSQLMSEMKKQNEYDFTYTLSDGQRTAYAVRHSISQAPSMIPSRTMPPGPVESPTSSRYNAAIGTPASEERASPATYYPQDGSQLSLDATTASNRRRSVDPTYQPPASNRPGTFSGRQPEANASTLGNQFLERAPYSFARGVHTSSEHRRPSNTNAHVSMTSDATRGQALNLTNDSTHTDLNDDFNRALTLDSTTESFNGYMSNGYSTANHQIQLNPTSQSWQHDINSGSRNFNHGSQAETWNEAPHSSYSGAKRGSTERNSPAGSLYRPYGNSPRNLSGTPNPRASSSWNQPVVRNPTVSQDLDRQHQSQYSQPPPGFYPYTHLAQYPTPYDQYTQQAPNYRHHVTANGYAVPLNCISLPLQANRDREPAQSPRSQLLEEFRAQSKANRRYELREIYGHIVEFSGDQHGSRFIQDKIVVANSEEKDRVFSEIEPNAVQLMKDVFGNYVIQKFLEHGALFQKRVLAMQMMGKLTELSNQMYSCRVVQKALDHILVEEQRAMIDELRPTIVIVAKDQNGNHVVQKIIQMHPQHCIPFIMEAFKGQIEQLASHGYACRVIQRILEHGTPAERKRLMADIHTCAGRLLTDQYGNYVIQHIISHGEPDDRSIIIQQVIERAFILSKHKYASNVVEKCIEFGTAEERNAIRAKITAASVDGMNPLQQLMKDQFGNYVIQKMVEKLEGPERLTFASEVKAYIPILRKQGGGRQNAGLDRLATAVDTVFLTSDTNGSATTAGTAPSTPSLAVEMNSAVPTPLLTTEQNSPQSSSPPSTSISTTDEAGEDAKAAHASRPDKAPHVVRDQEN
ncbi:ARM repeat-containing protein [Xylaria sp. FL0043]|nr:ARM repeat-containing protein [Xylaria sp. FL0043]